MIYLPKFNGFLNDVADIDFLRSDGVAFRFDKASATSLNGTRNTTPIQGGAYKYPIGYLEGDDSLEVSFTSQEFDQELFEMAQSTKTTVKDVGVLESGWYAVVAGQTISLPFETQAASIKIRGLALAEVLAAGKFTVTVTQYAAAVADGEPTAAKTLITFNTGDVAVGDEIRVSYRRRIVDANVLTITEKTTSARGELAIHWPISSDGLGDGSSSRKGILHVVIPRVMVSALPGFDNSYKSASTNSVSFQAMNPRRADQKIYDIYYELLNNSGGFRTEATAGTVSYT